MTVTTLTSSSLSKFPKILSPPFLPSPISATGSSGLYPTSRVGFAHPIVVVLVVVLSVAVHAVIVRVHSGSLQVVVVEAGYLITVQSTSQCDAVWRSRQVWSFWLPPGGAPESTQPGPTQLVPEGQKGPRQPQMIQPKPSPQLKKHGRPHICPSRQVGMILSVLGNPKVGGGWSEE